MRNYQCRKRRQQEHEPAELQWLEDGINILINFTIKALTTLFSVSWTLISGESSSRR